MICNVPQKVAERELESFEGMSVIINLIQVDILANFFGLWGMPIFGDGGNPNLN